MKLKTMDYILYKSPANWTNFWKSKLLFASFLIKIGTFSNYVHVGRVLEVGDKKIVVGQALNDFVISNEYFYLDTLKKNNLIKVLRLPRVTQAQKDLFIKEAYKIKGTGYDWIGIFRLFMHILFNKMVLKDNAKAFFCSEASDYLDLKVGVKLFDKSSDLVTPADYLEVKKLKRVDLND